MIKKNIRYDSVEIGDTTLHEMIVEYNYLERNENGRLLFQIDAIITYMNYNEIPSESIYCSRSSIITALQPQVFFYRYPQITELFESYKKEENDYELNQTDLIKLNLYKPFNENNLLKIASFFRNLDDVESYYYPDFILDSSKENFSNRFLENYSRFLNSDINYFMRIPFQHIYNPGFYSEENTDRWVWFIISESFKFFSSDNISIKKDKDEIWDSIPVKSIELIDLYLDKRSEISFGYEEIKNEKRFVYFIDTNNRISIIATT